MLATIFKSMDNENIKCTFHLCFDDNLMNKIFEHTNHRMSKSNVQLWRNDNFIQLDKGCWVKVTDNIEFDALSKLMCLTRLLRVNPHLTDRLFSGDSHFMFSSIKSKTCCKFLEGKFPLAIVKIYKKFGKHTHLVPGRRFRRCVI